MKNYLRYFYALLAVPLAILLRFVLTPLMGTGTPYVTLFPVTVGVALLAGKGPAILTGILGSIAIDYLFIPPLYAVELNVEGFSRMAIVVLTSVFVGYVGEVLQAARAKAEKQALILRDSQMDLNRAQAVANTGSWRLDVQHDELTWSDENHRIFGISKGTPMTYETFLAAVHPDDRAYVDQKWMAALRGEPYDIEHRIVADGSLKWVRERANLELDKDGTLLGGFGTTHDVTERKQIEDTLKFLVQCDDPSSGEDFFQSLARYLGQSLGMDYVCIDRLHEDSLSAETVAIYFDGEFEDNVSYTLKDTPCGDVVGKTICCFAKDVRRLFPMDVVLQKMAAESYVGTTLWSSQGQPIGLIAIIGRKPLADTTLATSILQLVAVRAAGELERRQAEEMVRQARDNLEKTNSQLQVEIAHRKQISDDLARSNKDLEQFAYVASHDLQEPLRAVSGFVDILKLQMEGSLDAKKTEYMNHVVDGVSRMRSLINGLLEYSRVSTLGKPPELTDCKAAMERAILNLQVGIRESGAKVTAGPLPKVCVDSVQLVQLLQNLIGNAIKFRGEPAPDVHISASHQDNEWLFAVTDNGIGIEPQYAQRIFLIFQRLHSRSKYQGTGIGLAICRKIIERHGGKIWVESNPGSGSTFYFTVPDTGVN
jgi:PAS domain S-box-containing protein